MKLVREPKIDIITPSAGCVCYDSENHKETRGLWHPWISCKCGCMNSENRAYNKSDADKA